MGFEMHKRIESIFETCPATFEFSEEFLKYSNMKNPVRCQKKPHNNNFHRLSIRISDKIVSWYIWGTSDQDYIFTGSR